MSATKTRTPNEVRNVDLELPEFLTDAPQGPAERHIADVWFDKTIPLAERLAFRDAWNERQPYTSRAGVNFSGFQMWQTARNRNRFCDLGDGPNSYGGSGRIYSWDAPRPVAYKVGDEERIGYVMDVYDLGLNAAEPMKRIGVVQQRTRILLDDGSVEYIETPFPNEGLPYREVYPWLKAYCLAQAEAFANSEAGAAQRAKMEAFAQAEFQRNNPAAAARAALNARQVALRDLKTQIEACTVARTREKLVKQFHADKAAYDEAKAAYLAQGDAVSTAF